MAKKLVWDDEAIAFFKEAIEYIREDSPKNAEKVKNNILDKVDDLLERPELPSR